MKITKELYKAFYGLGDSVEGYPSKFNIYKLFYQWREETGYPVDFFGMEYMSHDSPEDYDGLFCVINPDNVTLLGEFPSYLDEDEFLDKCYYEFGNYLEKEIPKFGFTLVKKHPMVLYFQEAEE